MTKQTSDERANEAITAMSRYLEDAFEASPLAAESAARFLWEIAVHALDEERAPNCHRPLAE